MAWHALRAQPNSGVMGHVYLIHLHAPIGHAQHYSGWALDLERRLQHHRNGTGANLLRVARRRDITWEVALTFPGDKNTERQFKNRGGARRHCPICARENSNGKSQSA